jgi:UDPglucose--hexose-1-phosphate uridylyltransferase
MIVATEHAKVFIPVCARYPYETWIVPTRPVQFIHELSLEERRDLALALKTVLMKYDKMWDRPFPYLMSLFQAPTDGGNYEGVQAHFQIFPPYRTRDKLKYLAGTELAAGMFVNDSLPEEKAAELRDVKVDVK